MTNSFTMVFMIVIVAMMIGCVESKAPKSTSQDWDVQQPEPVEQPTQPKKTKTPTDPTTTPKKTPTPHANAICLPQANPWTDNWGHGVNLRQWVMDAQTLGCAVQRNGTSQPTAAQLNGVATYGEPGDKSCDNQGCWETLFNSVRAWSSTQDRNLGMRLTHEQWVGIVEARQHDTTGVLEATLTAATYGSNALRTYTQRWDKQGQLLYTRHQFNQSLWSEVQYTYQNGLLMTTSVTDHVNGTEGADMRFTYDDQKRLIHGELSHRKTGEISTVDWQYEGARPATVTRKINGIVWLRQSWQYDNDGFVTTHESFVDPQHNHGFYRTYLLDDHAPTAPVVQSQWDQNRYHSTPSCDRLPTTTDYGYPQADNTYHLGWSNTHRPSGLDQRYGFPAAYVTAERGWFGHHGVDGGMFRRPQHPTTTTTTYLNGVMQSSQSTIVLPQANPTESPTENPTENPTEIPTEQPKVLTVKRQRIFDNGKLVKDILTEDHGEVTERVLDFQYDTNGRLVGRKLSWDNTLVAQQTWQVQDAPARCQVTAHNIGFSSKAFNNGWRLEPGTTLEGIDPSMDIQSQYRINANDNCTRITWSTSFDQGTRFTTYDAQDRVIESGQTHADYTTTSSSTFDPKTGQLLRASTTSNGETHTSLIHTFDELGHLTSRNWRYNARNNPQERYQISCQ